MIKVDHIEVWGFEHAIRGMRNPLNSWDKSDSGNGCCKSTNYQKFVLCDNCPEECVGNALCDRENSYYQIGENDLDLMHRLYVAGADGNFAHRKFLRQIFVSMDITAPDYFFKEFSTYKVGVVENSTSTMHRIHSKEFTLDDFSHEHLISEYSHSEYQEIDFDESESKKVAIEGYEDYLVSENGVVYSLKNGNKHALMQRVDIDGYKTVGLYKNGKAKRFKVHRLVAIAFLDRPDGKDCVNHIDGNKWNNQVSNLEWCTRSENSKHAYNMGLANYGSKQRIGARNKARYSVEDIQEIKSLYFNKGLSQRKIGELFNCDHSTISDIVNNKLYKEIQKAPYELLEDIIDELNSLRDAFVNTKDKRYWYSIIQLLPMSYNYTRTVTMNYENVLNMIKQRTGHKLDEWNEFVDILWELPYMKEIAGEMAIKALEKEKADETTDHTEWIDYQDGQWIYAKCPVCGSVRNTKTPFCPICGTKMKGVIGK